MLIRTVAPAGLAVTLEEALQQCRVDSVDLYPQVQQALAAAIDFFEQETGVTLAPTTYAQTWDGWPCDSLQLKAAPVRDVREVEYLDADNHWHALSGATDFYWLLNDEGAEVVFVEGFAAPTLSGRRQNLRVIFDAGYDLPDVSGSGDDPRLILPVSAKQAVLILTSHWFDHRGVSGKAEELAFSAKVLLQKHRIFR